MSSPPCSAPCAVDTSAAFAAVVSRLCATPVAASTPMCAFIPKCHWLPFFLSCISGSRSPLAFFVELGASTMLASTIVPLRTLCPSDGRWPLISVNRPSEGFRALERAEKVRLVRTDDGLPLSRKCALAGVSRGSLYYEPRPVDARTLALQLAVDKLYMEFRYYGTRRVMLHLRREGHAVGRDKARSLMAAVGWRTIHPGPRTTKPQPGHRIYPYLLRDMDAIRPGEVWCADITYIPVRGGFFYLVAVMDWASRFVLSWELDNTMEVGSA